MGIMAVLLFSAGYLGVYQLEAMVDCHPFS